MLLRFPGEFVKLKRLPVDPCCGCDVGDVHLGEAYLISLDGC